MDWTTNAIGRKIPVEIEGRKLRPFAGAHADSAPGGSSGSRRTAGGPSRTPPGRGAPDKRVATWDDLLDRMDVRSGQTISFHHHLRDGDAIVNEVVARLAARGVRDLTLATTLFSVHERLVPFVESGVVARIEGSMYGPVGAACTRGAMKGLASLLARKLNLVQEYEDMVPTFVEQMLDLHKKLAASAIPEDRALYQRQIEASDRQIDALVYELYGLTEEEIAIVERASA